MSPRRGPVSPETAEFKAVKEVAPEFTRRYANDISKHIFKTGITENPGPLCQRAHNIWRRRSYKGACDYEYERNYPGAVYGVLFLYPSITLMRVAVETRTILE